MTPNFPLRNATLLVALASVYPMQVLANAGVAQFAAGSVTVNRGGATQPLAKGQQVANGDVIQTGAGSHAQVRFSDGGLVALQANTQFAIRNYADQGSGAQSDSFIVDFLQGGMRALTGLIGKRNPANNKVNAKTATIGIRGSGFAAAYNPDGTMTIGATQDEIVVCTNAGCVGLTVGEIARVTQDSSVPTRTNVRTNLPLVELRQDPQLPGNQSGNQAAISAPVTGLSAAFAANDGGYSGASLIPGYSVFSNGTGTFASGQLARYTSDADETVTKTGSSVGTFGTLGNLTDSDFLGWGYWVAGSKSGGYMGDSSLTDVHYVVGKPTPSDLMPGSGTASYALVSGTAPTAISGGTVLTGQLVSGGLNVNFGSGFVDISLETRFVSGGSTYDIGVSNSAFISGSTFSCGGSTSIAGIFTGALAARAGLTYTKTGTPVGTISGAAAFVQSSSSGLIIGIPD